jgi:hypothetical protein
MFSLAWGLPSIFLTFLNGRSVSDNHSKQAYGLLWADDVFHSLLGLSRNAVGQTHPAMSKRCVEETRSGDSELERLSKRT